MTHVMTSRESNPNFMNGVPELLILRLLESAEMYGYEIVHAISERTESVIVVGEGVVYPVLHALERTRGIEVATQGRGRAEPNLLLSDEGWIPEVGGPSGAVDEFGRGHPKDPSGRAVWQCGCMICGSSCYAPV